MTDPQDTAAALGLMAALNEVEEARNAVIAAANWLDRAMANLQARVEIEKAMTGAGPHPVNLKDRRE
jgi:hypothetical protein